SSPTRSSRSQEPNPSWAVFTRRRACCSWIPPASSIYHPSSSGRSARRDGSEAAQGLAASSLPPTASSLLPPLTRPTASRLHVSCPGEHALLSTNSTKQRRAFDA